MIFTCSYNIAHICIYNNAKYMQILGKLFVEHILEDAVFNQLQIYSPLTSKTLAHMHEWTHLSYSSTLISDSPRGGEIEERKSEAVVALRAAPAFLI